MQLLNSEESQLKSSATQNNDVILFIAPHSAVNKLRANNNSNFQELNDVAADRNSGPSSDYDNIEFDVNVFPSKHDLLDYEYSVGGGLGVGAQAVNTTVVQMRLGSPLWGILPPVVAATTLTYTILDNKDKLWQEEHKVAMDRFSKVITGVKFSGAFFFGQGLVMQLWQGDKFTLAAKLGVPASALGLIIPIALLEERQAIAENSSVPRRARNCMSHPATVKIIEVLSQGIGADSGMSSILVIVVGFQKLDPTNAIIISAAVAGANMVVEALPKDKIYAIDALKKMTDVMRTTVKAGALGAAVLNLLFSIIAGATENHKVPDFVAPLAGGLLALAILPALGYRLYSYCRQPHTQNSQDAVEVLENKSNNDLESGLVAQPVIAQSQNPSGFFTGAKAEQVSTAAETDRLIPKVTDERVSSQSLEKSSRCTIL